MQAPDMEKKVVIVTGSASGIGRAIAERFAIEGSNVVLADLDNNGIESVAEKIIANGGSNISIDGNSIAPDPNTTTSTVGGQSQTWTGLDINSRGNVTITNQGQPFQFVETYRGPSLQNVTNIQRTTNIESTTETTSVFSQ